MRIVIARSVIDGRIKPDVVALAQVWCTESRNRIRLQHGRRLYVVECPAYLGFMRTPFGGAPDWTPSDVIEALKATAHDLGTPGPDNDSDGDCRTVWPR